MKVKSMIQSLTDSSYALDRIAVALEEQNRILADMIAKMNKEE